MQTNEAYGTLYFDAVALVQYPDNLCSKTMKPLGEMLHYKKHLHLYFILLKTIATMKKIATTLLFAILSLGYTHAQLLEVESAGQLPFNNTTQLIESFFAGTGVNLLSVQYIGDPVAIGYFKGGTTALGLENGLLMTTGRAKTQGGNNGANGSGNDFASNINLGGSVEPGLQALVTQDLNDVSSFRITFQPYGDSIRFRYVFASEEYPEYACSAYNDIFAFFLDGPNPDGGNYADFNIALIPGTNLPVSINTIHPENPAVPTCAALNSQYYINNNSSNQPVYDGIIVPLIAAAAVVPCATYTMTLSIADVGDSAFDAAVFLEANSFGGEVAYSSTIDDADNILPEIADADTVSISFESLPTGLLPITVTLGGTAQNGVDYQMVDTLYTISNTDSVLQLVFQPIFDTITEIIETIDIRISNGSCLNQVYSIYVADSDSSGINWPIEVQLAAGAAIVLDPTVFSFEQAQFKFEKLEVEDSLITSAGLVSNLSVNLPFLNKLINPNLIESVCVNIEHNWIDDIDLYLRAPNGSFVELTTDNGGNGDDYTNTCFSPTSTSPINFPGPFAPASAAPFTGTFGAEGDWDGLQGTPLSGDWSLIALDDISGINGYLKSWSMCITGLKLGNFKYQWSTGDTTATLMVTEPGLYKVTISNSLGRFQRSYLVGEACAYTAMNTTICPGQTFEFGGVVFDENHLTDTVAFDIPGAVCDSLVLVNVTLLPTFNTTIQAVIAFGESYIFNGVSYNQTGEYITNLQASNGCDSTVVLQLEVLSNTQEPDQYRIAIRPNPTQTDIQISWDAGAITFERIRLYDMLGCLHDEQNIAGATGQYTASMEHLQRGTYLLILEDAEGGVVRRKVVKR